jgi:hypothetical protein
MTTPSDDELFARLAEIPDTAAVAARPLPPKPALAPAPARKAVERRRFAALGVSALWLGLNLALFGLRGDLRALPAPYLEAQLLLPAVLAASCLALALASGRLGLGLGRRIVAALVFTAPLVFCMLACATPLPDAHDAGNASLIPLFVCMNLTFVWATPPLLLAARALRGAFPTASRWRGGLVGAAVGLFAGTTINLHCSNVAHVHLLFGHALPVVVATLLGALLVSRWTRA